MWTIRHELQARLDWPSIAPTIRLPSSLCAASVCKTPTISDWSMDGRFIAFTNSSSAINNELIGDVWLIDMARGRKVIRLISTPFHEANPTFSPGGRWLAFTSDESGWTELYVQAFAGR